MIKLSYVIPYHLKNALFDVGNKHVNRDNFAYGHCLLKKYFLSKTMDLSTYDINPIQGSGVVIYNDMSSKLSKKNNINKLYLILFEREVIKPDNWDIEKHPFLRKIFTWRDELVNNKKYFKVNFSHLIRLAIYKDITQNHKLCMVISGNKRVFHLLDFILKDFVLFNGLESD